ncbi:APC family permease [Piscirickettsia litoralis]|uniref:Amino acid transporter n=1 Tax=Piscirickettsia litoralis TaxID=1891921 RepID=A0ABX3A7V9_9GAMM|nr:APC family permease [Piscirickettsia litoralis]ODN43718.1 amino acid transporter [Piscirickettsia litoralis]
MKLRRLLFGAPLSIEKMADVRLSKKMALAIFSSDALSSVAYATEEILGALMIAGSAAFSFTLPIGLAICLLILIVGASYRQTITAYPSGGGAFTVAKENLGNGAGLLAAAALIIDYILTVAVSVSAGIRAITSAFPELMPHAVALSVLAIIIITWLNLRGLHETAGIFAAPTYIFVGLIYLLIIIGLFHLFNGFHHDHAHLDPIPAGGFEAGSIGIILILRAFSSGCSALTGIEAVSNGVQAFKEPCAKNANRTLTAMALILMTMFLGVTVLADSLHIYPNTTQSVLSQIAHTVFGQGLVGSSLYYALQVATALILLLAANTSFSGFPRLASVLAEYNYLPRQLRNIGDRLAYSNGIVMLAVIAILLVIAFQADTHSLIPLYSIGVFLAFSLSQAGVARYFIKRRLSGWLWKSGISIIGCITTSIAFVVIAESKFTSGAWVVFLIAPLLLYLFYKVHRHYKEVDVELSVDNIHDDDLLSYDDPLPKVVVPISKLHRGTMAALRFARTLSDDVTAVVIDTHDNGERLDKLKESWRELQIPEQLIVLDSPYRATISPLLRYIKRVDMREPERGCAVIVIPEAVPTRWWHHFLHNRKAMLLRAALMYNPITRCGSTRVFVGVPYRLTH